MSRILNLTLFLVLVVGAGIVIGITNDPGDWYEGLTKPAFNPPDWVFAPAWTVLYILIAIAGWRTFEQAPRGGRMMLWAGQMLLNFLWTPIFFGLNMMTLALLVIVLLLATIVAFVAVSWRADRISALLFIPYAGWVAFAALLNLSLLWLN